MPVSSQLSDADRCRHNHLIWGGHLMSEGFPDSSLGKESACNTGDPGSGRSTGERDRLPIPLFLDFSCGSAGKASACQGRETWVQSVLGRSPGEGKGYPLQYSGLENSMDYRVHGVAKRWTRLSDFHFHISPSGEWGSFLSGRGWSSFISSWFDWVLCLCSSSRLLCTRDQEMCSKWAPREEGCERAAALTSGLGLLTFLTLLDSGPSSMGLCLRVVSPFFKKGHFVPQIADLLGYWTFHAKCVPVCF